MALKCKKNLTGLSPPKGEKPQNEAGQNKCGAEGHIGQKEPNSSGSGRGVHTHAGGGLRREYGERKNSARPALPGWGGPKCSTTDREKMASTAPHAQEKEREKPRSENLEEGPFHACEESAPLERLGDRRGRDLSMTRWKRKKKKESADGGAGDSWEAKRGGCAQSAKKKKQDFRGPSIEKRKKKLQLGTKRKRLPQTWLAELLLKEKTSPMEGPSPRRTAQGGGRGATLSGSTTAGGGRPEKA